MKTASIPAPPPSATRSRRSWRGASKNPPPAAQSITHCINHFMACTHSLTPPPLPPRTAGRSIHNAIKVLKRANFPHLSSYFATLQSGSVTQIFRRRNQMNVCRVQIETNIVWLGRSISSVDAGDLDCSNISHAKHHILPLALFAEYIMRDGRTPDWSTGNAPVTRFALHQRPTE